MNQTNTTMETAANEFALLSRAVFVELNEEGCVQQVSSNFSNEFGFPTVSVQKTFWQECLEDDPLTPFKSRCETAKSQMQPILFPLVLKHPKQGLVPVRCRMQYLAQSQRFFLALRISSQAENNLPQTLQKTLDHLNLSIKTANMGVWEVELTQDNRSVTRVIWDEEMLRMHGVPAGADVQTMQWFYDHVHPDDLQTLLARHEEFLKHPGPGILHINYRMLWPNGEVHYIDMHGSVGVSEFQAGHIKMYGVAKDITEDVVKRKFLEDQKNRIIANSRMTVLGEISGGIAHEINNPLTVIQARAFQLFQMLEQNALDPVKVRAISDSISKTADKIAKIIKTIRAFAQNHENTPFDLVSISDLVEETLDFCKVRFYNHGIDIRVGPIPEDLELECRLIQLEEVLLNLFNNAHDAVAKLPERWILVEAFDKDPNVEIHVTDSGSGVADPVADQMMMPFFTTKETGKGTGLGLSISAEIVHSHHGEILLDRTSSHTRFVLRFPKFQPTSSGEVTNEPL